MNRFALLAVITFAVRTLAADPPVPTAAGPAVGYGQVVVKDDKVVLALRQLDMVSTAEVRTVTEYQTVTRNTPQGLVTEKVPVTKAITVTVLKPQGWRTVHLPLDAKGVSITDTAGEDIPALKLAGLLAKETPVLVAVNDAPDKQYLLTTKPGTVIVVVPTALLGHGVAAGTPDDERFPPGFRPGIVRPVPRVIIQPPAPK